MEIAPYIHNIHRSGVRIQHLYFGHQAGYDVKSDIVHVVEYHKASLSRERSWTSHCMKEIRQMATTVRSVHSEEQGSTLDYIER